VADLLFPLKLAYVFFYVDVCEGMLSDRYFKGKKSAHSYTYRKKYC